MNLSKSSNNILIIAGATATGKTKLSIETAIKHKCEIINFDSLLFYNEINIGTAKPNQNELEQAPHHLINIRSIAKPLNASSFLELALPKVLQLHKENKNIILVGGSGFYLQALLNGVYDAPTVEPHIRLKSEELYQKEGIEPFLKELKEVDSESFLRYHENDHYRIRRAIEHFWQTQTPFSDSRNLKSRTQESFPKNLYQWNIQSIYLDIPKEDHFQLIQKRTQQMIESGLIEEVESLLKTFTGDEKPLQSIGYKQVLEHLSNHSSKDELKEKINIATRQLAKSQRTWFKKRMPEPFNILQDQKEINTKIDLFFKDFI